MPGATFFTAMLWTEQLICVFGFCSDSFLVEKAAVYITLMNKRNSSMPGINSRGQPEVRKETKEGEKEREKDKNENNKN